MTTHRLAGYRIKVQSAASPCWPDDRSGEPAWECTVYDGRIRLGSWYVVASSEAYAAGESLTMATGITTER